VHAKGGYIFCQLWHVRIPSSNAIYPTDRPQVGRIALSSLLNGGAPLSASATNANSRNRLTGGKPTETAHEMTVKEIRQTVAEHVHAAECAIEAGFDGVELVCPLSLSPFLLLRLSSW
jgi:N-ethylmaleimide reductase